MQATRKQGHKKGKQQDQEPKSSKTAICSKDSKHTPEKQGNTNNQQDRKPKSSNNAATCTSKCNQKQHTDSRDAEQQEKEQGSAEKQQTTKATLENEAPGGENKRPPIVPMRCITCIAQIAICVRQRLRNTMRAFQWARTRPGPSTSLRKK